MIRKNAVYDRLLNSRFFSLFRTVLLVISLVLLSIGTAWAEQDVVRDSPASERNINTIGNISSFLSSDSTNDHLYLPFYTCGHYSRDLVRNASNQNISLGSIILGNHPRFAGYGNHIMNYFIQLDENNTPSIIIIEPQNDGIYPLSSCSDYKYFRLYPHGTQVPSNWRGNMAYTGIILHQEV